MHINTLASTSNKDTSSVGTSINLSNISEVSRKRHRVNSTKASVCAQVGPGSTVIIRAVDTINTVHPSGNKDALLSILLGSDGDCVGLAWAGNLGEGGAKVGGFVETRVGGDVDGSGCEGGGSDGMGDALWGSSRWGEWATVDGGEEGPSTSGIDGLWFDLVGSDSGDPAEVLSWGSEWGVVDGDDGSLPVVPDDSRTIGRDSGLSASLVGWGSGVNSPGLTRVVGDGKLSGITSGADTDDGGGVLAGIIDRRGGWPGWKSPGLGWGDGDIVMAKADDITDSGEKARTSWWGSKTQDCGFFDTSGEGRKSNLSIWLVPVGEVVGSKDSGTGSVVKVVRVEGVDFETLNHPSDSLSVGISLWDVWIVQPGSGGDVVVVAFLDIWVVAPGPDWRPGLTTVERAVDGGIWPPLVEGCGHDDIWLLSIDSKTSEAVTVLGW